MINLYTKLKVLFLKKVILFHTLNKSQNSLCNNLNFKPMFSKINYEKLMKPMKKRKGRVLLIKTQ